MVTLVAWPDADANSYNTIAEADLYLDARLGATAWADASTAERVQALITTTRALDRQLWQGEKTDSAQPLAFPRTGVVDKYGDAIADDEIPADFMLGFFEYALALLEDEATQDVGAAGSNTKRVKAGPVEVEFFTPTLGRQGRFPEVVNELLGQFLSGGVQSDAGGYASGTDLESFFDDDANSYDLSDAYP